MVDWEVREKVTGEKCKGKEGKTEQKLWQNGTKHKVYVGLRDLFF